MELTSQAKWCYFLCDCEEVGWRLTREQVNT